MKISSVVTLLTATLLAAWTLSCGSETERAPASDTAGATAVAPSAEASRGTTANGLLLRDATADWNLDFAHHTGGRGGLLFPEMMGSGVAIFDPDGDDDLDLYFVSGAEGYDRESRTFVNRLFLQDEDGRFIEATAGSGLDDPGYGTGVAVGDYDNDGDEDVFVANVGPDRLYGNNGDGTFTDISESAGISAAASVFDDWSSSAAFCDIDRDGFLDLYVVRYIVWDPDIRCTDTAGRQEYCGPDSFEDRTDRLLLNRGDGRFTDITSRAGIDQSAGAGLGVLCEDMDDDGWVDIYVANDGDPNQLWMNQRDGTFIDDALIMGASVNAAGLHEAGMGVVAGDFDNDADLDLFLTHLRDETNTFYRNLGAGIGFEDQTTRVGLATASTPYTGFGTAAIDVDLDGDLDLVIANGRVLRGPPLTSELPPPWNLYAEPNLAYANDDGRFELLTSEMAEFVDHIDVSRGLAVGDLDADGDLDIVVNSLEDKARIYRAEPPSSHWLIVDTLDPRLGRRALGARVVLESASGPQMRTVQSATSYLSSRDPRAHFGLGDDPSPVTLMVRWPDGLEETWSDVAADQVVVLRRGEGAS